MVYKLIKLLPHRYNLTNLLLTVITSTIYPTVFKTFMGPWLKLFRAPSRTSLLFVHPHMEPINYSDCQVSKTTILPHEPPSKVRSASPRPTNRKPRTEGRQIIRPPPHTTGNIFGQKEISLVWKHYYSAALLKQWMWEITSANKTWSHLTLIKLLQHLEKKGGGQNWMYPALRLASIYLLNYGCCVGNYNTSLTAFWGLALCCTAVNSCSVKQLYWHC